MRSACALALGLSLLAGCKPDPHRDDAGPPPLWWKPKPGETADWDIQLAAPFNLSAQRAMYMLDLWDVVPAPTALDYGDGSPVTVPAGRLPAAVAELHGHSPPAIVVCQVSTGAIRLTDPDAMKFPGYAASPPNRPNPPASGSVIGWSTSDTTPQERFLDIHTSSHATVVPLIAKRFELAQRIGCDAVGVHYHDLLAYQTNPGHGFADLVASDYQGWSTEITERAHGLEISIGLRSSSAQGIDGTTRSFDWLMIERCGEYTECDHAQPYVNAQKAVFAIEYELNEQSGMSNSMSAICSELARRGIEDGIFKNAALDSAYYMRCM